MNDYLKEFDEIICGDNVVKKFYTRFSDVNFKTWLGNFFPNILKCEKQQQNNPWHKYNVLGHILHSVEQMNKLSKNLPCEDRKMLSYVMLFHDIGKPDKHITRIKEGKMIDSFFDHNIRSAEIAKEYLPKFGFDKSQTAIIEKLVFKHDIFMFIKPFKSNNPHWRVLDKSLIKEEIDDLNSVGDGKKLLKYLLLVGKADNLAQNETMTAQSLELLEDFSQLLD